MKYPQQVIIQLLALPDKTLVLVGGRILFALLLLSVQGYVLRAMLRIIRAVQIGRNRGRILIIGAVVLLVIVNLPLGVFIIESVIRPHELLLYAPPAKYELAVRPFA